MLVPGSVIFSEWRLIWWYDTLKSAVPATICFQVKYRQKEILCLELRCGQFMVALKLASAPWILWGSKTDDVAPTLIYAPRSTGKLFLTILSNVSWFSYSSYCKCYVIYPLGAHRSGLIPWCAYGAFPPPWDLTRTPTAKEDYTVKTRGTTRGRFLLLFSELRVHS